MLKVILICIGIYFLMKWMLRPVLRMVFQKAVQDFVNKSGNGGGGGYYYKEVRFGGAKQEKPKPEGTINIDHTNVSPNHKKISDDEGEYVDYVEVK